MPLKRGDFTGRTRRFIFGAKMPKTYHCSTLYECLAPAGILHQGHTGRNCFKFQATNLFSGIFQWYFVFLQHKSNPTWQSDTMAPQVIVLGVIWRQLHCLCVRQRKFCFHDRHFDCVLSLRRLTLSNWDRDWSLRFAFVSSVCISSSQYQCQERQPPQVARRGATPTAQRKTEKHGLGEHDRRVKFSFWAWFCKTQRGFWLIPFPNT